MGQGAALVLTLVVECLVVVVLLRPSVIGMSRIIAAAAAASLLTHPFAWRAAAALSPDGYAQGVAIIEVAVVLVEAAVLRLLLPSMRGARSSSRRSPTSSRSPQVSR